jgi:CheY-like chemotaxis protein
MRQSEVTPGTSSEQSKNRRGMQLRFPASCCRTPGENAYAKLAIDPRSRKIVLCIDDDPNMLMIRRMLLENAGYRVLTTSNGCDGIKVFSAGVADVAVLDYAMPLMNGSAVAAQMRQIKADIPLILLSGCTSIPEEDYTLFDHCISKGDAPSRLFSALEKACLDSDRQNR